MRTTMTIDDEIAQILYQESKEKGLSFKEIVNATLRRGIIAGRTSTRTRTVVVRPFEGGLLPGIDPDRMNQMVDELETSAFREKMERE